MDWGTRDRTTWSERRGSGFDPRHLQVEVRDGMLHVSYEHEAEWRPNNGEASGRQYAGI